MTILHKLDPHLIQQIAAGEVIERPASVVKELVDNALDAGATAISVALRQGGKSFIRVEDNGCGLSKDDMLLAIERHTTSKLETDLSHISTYGFRGEGLASVAFASRMVISSMLPHQDHGWTLNLEQGQPLTWSPCVARPGTCIEVRDLFYAMPARLKFMRAAQTEQALIMAYLEKMMLMHAEVGFEVQFENKTKIYPRGLNERLTLFFGKDFLERSFELNQNHQEYHLQAYVGLPTFTRSAPDQQLFFVNQRPIKDKILSRCLKMAFDDVIPEGHHSLGVFFLTLPQEDVDINVHPAKTEVRFRDVRFLQAFFMRVLKSGLEIHGQKAAGPKRSLEHWLFPVTPPQSYAPQEKSLMETSRLALRDSAFDTPLFLTHPPSLDQPLPQEKSQESQEECQPHKHHHDKPLHRLNLGRPLGQIQNRYVLAQNAQGLVVVDPHAAHERIVYERLKDKPYDVTPTPLLMAQAVSLSAEDLETLSQAQGCFEDLGLIYEVRMGYCLVRALPLVFKNQPLDVFFERLLEGLKTLEPKSALVRLEHKILAHDACRQSIRLGQPLSFKEMEDLLRHIETTDHSAQCNHGRPSYKIFPLSYFDRLFERS